MLHQIAETFKAKRNVLEEFFHEKSSGLIPPVYLSCDIRHSGKKLGVIDSNLFPAGFNNLCQAYGRQTAASFRIYFEKYHPTVRNIILLSEEHTRNRYYLDNIYRLKALLESAGFGVAAAYAGEQIQEDSIDLPLEGKRHLRMEKIIVEGGKARTSDLNADLILSNNDFSTGLPSNLVAVADQIFPNPNLGWHRRKKSHHFKILQKNIEEFSKRLNLDPWLLYGLFDKTSATDLSTNGDLPELAATVGETLTRIETKYKEFSIEDPPYVFIKNNSGTYGMGLLEVSSPEEVLGLNRRRRNKLSSTKGGKNGNSFLIQEGIPTADFYSELPIEPVIYSVGWEIVGGFFRMNTERDATSSLNTRGMIFSCLCLHSLDEPHEDHYLNCAEKENLVYLSNVMARLAILAAAQELEEINT